MQRLVLDKKGRLKRVAVTPAIVVLILMAVIFAGVFFLTRKSLRFYAINKVLFQQDQWNKDGVLMQETRFTCVPASLVMLLKDKGITTDTFDITQLAGTNTEGTDCSVIPSIGEHFGFHVREETIGYDAIMAENLPSILTFTWQNMFHAVYAKPDKEHGWLEVKDPSVGLSTIDKKNWKEYFGTDEVDCFLFEGKGK